jgi:phytoene synthase
VWGFRGGVTPKDAEAPAEAAGIAFQLTNILRDLGEDLGRGRVYLPADELALCPPEEWRTPAFRELMRFQIERARHYYRLSEPLPRLLTPDGAAIFGVMSGTYRALLDEIEARGYDVFTRRVRVPKCRTALMLARGWLTKRGWA